MPPVEIFAISQNAWDQFLLLVPTWSQRLLSLSITRARGSVILSITMSLWLHLSITLSLWLHYCQSLWACGSVTMLASGFGVLSRTTLAGPCQQNPTSTQHKTHTVYRTSDSSTPGPFLGVTPNLYISCPSPQPDTPLLLHRCSHSATNPHQQGH